ncbi:protein FAM83H [Enoplosus armatus]|uniref:protein FAM83H n=1 Tax=Enoplosus armatus TaxID=215367 RepID=UPI003992C55D
MARRSQCSSAGDNPLDPNYLPPHYREEYRLAIDALVEEDLEGYYQFLQKADVVDFLSSPEIQYIQSSVQVPQQSNHPEQHFLDTGEDGSSDTYWPIHSDLDAPGLDLGWPQQHHFIGPTEVTTLVNPSEPDMPSIKEQARRLIKNAQQVVAIVMDMFTDVDMFADILNAAMRNVAVYILLDQQNAHHFVNMVSNCRVNLQSIQFLRVRTVSGITYHCRSGKSFQGQMMDRFLLTDCRAVLSGNYSFMWSFEKLNRCMAHLFLGQLVSTFDEEFRILFAQSQPLMIENMLAPMEDVSLLQKRHYPSEITSLYREPRKFLSVDTTHPEEWARHSYDEHMDMDRRMMPLNRQESMHGPADVYSRFPSRQSRMDPSLDQGPSRMLMMENPASKRHSYAEGVHGRYSYPFLQQQGMPERENQGWPFHKGQQPYPGPGKEADFSGYDKFWNQDYLSTDQYSEHGLLQEMEPPDNFDPVLNYLSSTRNVDFDQGSEKLPPTADVPFSSSHPRRLSLGQSYACQTSPTPSNPTDQKQFFQEPKTDRKDPMVKQGLRNWRISSYLSAYDNPGDEGLQSAPPNAPDPFEEPSNLMQQTASGIDLSFPKIPNVREFKVPAIPRASQMPSYVKTTAREQTKKLPDEPIAVAAETKTTRSPSESSSTTEGEKTEEAEQKEPKPAVLQREESFRRKYNAAVQRSSRLRSSLIFSSLEQQHTSQDTKTAPGQQDEENDKNEAEQTKLPFVSQVLGQRRSMAREPFEWSRYIKSATFDNSATDSSKPDEGNSKADDKDSSKDENSKDLSEVQDSLKQPDVEQANSSPSMPRSKPSEAELPKTDQAAQPPKALFTSPLYVDMSDPDMRLMFFKELAAKRKSAKAAEAEKSKEKAPMKKTTELKNNTTVKKEEDVPKETSEKMAGTSTSEGLSEKNANAEDAGKTVSTEACKSVNLSVDGSDKTNKEDSQVKNDPNISQSCKEEETRVSTDSEKIQLKDSQSAATLPVPAETEAPQSEPPEEPQLSNPTVENSSPSHPPTPTNATPANVPSLAQGTDERESPCLDSTSKHSSSLTPSSVEVAPSSVFATLDSNTQNPESVQLETSISSSPQISEEHTGSYFSSSNPSVQSSSSDHILPDSGSQISPSPSPSSSAPLSTPAETISSIVTPKDLSPTSTSSILSPNAQESVSPPPPEQSQSVEEISTASSISQTESTQAHLDSVSQLTAHVETDISPKTYAAGLEPNTSSLQSTTKTDSEESCAPTPTEKYVPESENNTVPKGVGEESGFFGSSRDVKADITPPTLSPSSPESCLPNVSDLEKKSRSDQNETITPSPSPADPPPEHSPAETSSPVNPDFTPNAQSETTASTQNEPIQATPPSKLNLTGSVTPSPAQTVSCFSPLTESVGSVLSPEAEKTLSALHSPSDTNSLLKQVTTDSNETPMLPSTETSSPTESTSKVPTEPDLPCKTPESVTSEPHPSEPNVPAEKSKMDSQNEGSKEPEMPDHGEKKTDDTEATNKANKTTTQESISENTNDQVRQNNCSKLSEITSDEVIAEITSDEVVAPSPQSKQPKSSQSRYHSSTANVLSSSNLRDDTKLLLEQISANCQSRNEATKESPVTDDEKEDEADKNAKSEKDRGIRALSRGQPKSDQEREKLLEKIQSMRKERKVYSRFEMAP